MAPTRRATLLALLAGVLLGVGFVLGDLWLDCRAPTSEACVWGRALRPVSLTLGAVLGGVAGLVARAVARAWKPRG